MANPLRPAWLLPALLLAAGQAAAAADPIADFYHSHPITIVIGFGPGETYDLYARLLARHMGRHIPGHPTLVPQNMPGAGSLNAANHLYNVAARDGSVFGVTHRFVPIMPLLAMEGAQFDAQKFTYLGSANQENAVCYARADSGIASLADLKSKTLVVGTTGKGAELTTFNATLRNVLGLKLKVISGYLTSIEVSNAVEKNELQGRCGESYGSLLQLHPDWVEKHSINFLIELGLTHDPKVPSVPLLPALVTDATDRQAVELMLSPSLMGRPFFGPPGMPRDRVEALRAAFDATMRDPELLAEAKQQRLDIMPMQGAAIEALLARLYHAPEAVVSRARALVAAE
jgi:tripartite-type tricarboxylate transporter receptor subunit TctC